MTYPDVVSGGFTVVRNDSGIMRAHFGFVLNAGDPHACITGYSSTVRRAVPARSRDGHAYGVACDVINGVDPNPGDSTNESGSNIRGEQNIGRSGGVGGTGPRAAPARRRGYPRMRRAPGRRARLPAARQPLRPHRGVNPGMPPAPDARRRGESTRVTSDARLRATRRTTRPRRRPTTAPDGGDDDRASTTPVPRCPRRRPASSRRGRRRPGDGGGSRLAPARARAGGPARPAARRRGLLWFTRPEASAVTTDDYVEACRRPGPASWT